MKRLLFAAAVLLFAGGAHTVSAQLKFGMALAWTLWIFWREPSFRLGLVCRLVRRNENLVRYSLCWLRNERCCPIQSRRLNMKAGVGGNNVDSGSKDLSTIEIHVNVRCTFGLGSSVSIFAETGSQFGFNVGKGLASLNAIHSACLGVRNISLPVVPV